MKCKWRNKGGSVLHLKPMFVLLETFASRFCVELIAYRPLSFTRIYSLFFLISRIGPCKNKTI